MLIYVEHLRLGDKVKFSPKSPITDKVVKLHLRNSDLMGQIVTVTHEAGCWTKPVGEEVEFVEHTL